MGERFNDDRLTGEDFEKAFAIVGEPRAHSVRRLRRPDLIIAPDGEDYLYRWHLVRGPSANTYFHIQTASDPERPLHDHPWDNFSVILAGGYDETIDTDPNPNYSIREHYQRRPGDAIYRKAQWAHRLELPLGTDYTMTLFSTGPKVREWGFWYPEGWKLWTDVTRFVGNKSIHLPHADANQHNAEAMS